MKPMKEEKNNRVSKYNKCFFLFFLCCSGAVSPLFSEQIVIPKKADLIIYSFDRPTQLFALLESIDLLVKNSGEINVIYRTSNQDFEQAYAAVGNYFKDVQFIKQTISPNNFKDLTFLSLSSLPSDYILFAVDDNIVTDYIDLSECIKLLEEANAYGFYLRLGKNIVHHYATDQVLKIPTLTPLNPGAPGVYYWHFWDGSLYWNYPYTVDMTVYRKSDLIIFEKLRFKTPNELELRWRTQARRNNHIAGRVGLCYEYSKIVNIPLNRVQEDDNFETRDMNALVPQTLLEYFEQGLKIDIKSLIGIKKRSAHIELIPPFIPLE